MAYPEVRTNQYVQVVHIEAMPLAVWFPIVWRRENDRLSLVVLRSLLSNGAGHNPQARRESSSLPLLFRAYPFRLQATEGGFAVTVTNVIADEPTDRGAAVLNAVGKLGRGAEQRCRALGLFSRHLASTLAMTDFLANRSLLDPWPLDVELPDQRISIQDLLVVRPAAFETGALSSFCLRFGSQGGSLLAAHRLSLFRTPALVSAARLESAPGDLVKV